MSSELAKVAGIAQDIQFENDLEKPIIGAAIKDPTTVGFIYLMGALGLCFVPGLGFVSAGFALLMGFFDVSATLKADTSEPAERAGDNWEPALPPVKTRAEFEKVPRAIAPAQTAHPPVNYDDSTYTEPSPWGPPVKKPPVKDDDKPEFLKLTPEREYLDGPEAYNEVEERVKERLKTKGAITPASVPDIARIMATPDADGYYRSRLLTAPTRTGKGLVTLAALTIVRTELGSDVELFGIDAKNDHKEAHRWSVIPAANRFQFSGTAPRVDAGAIAQQVWAITEAFYASRAKYKFLIISELKILMATMGKASKAQQSEFSSYLSNQACGGASSHSYIWIDTNVVGLGENGFNGQGDRDAFVLDYLVTRQNKKQVVGHNSFTGDADIPVGAFGETGRAFYSAAVGWHPVPASYDELDRAMKQASPPTVRMPQAPTREATDREAEDIATVCEGALRSQNALALTLEQIAAVHPGVKRMLNAPEHLPMLVASLEKANERGLIRLINMGGVLSVSRVSSKRVRNQA
jgi:hypothetical protein